MSDIFNSIGNFFEQYGRYSFWFMVSAALFAFVVVFRKKVFGYFKESIAELRKVTWPTKDKILRYSGIIILVSALVATYTGIADFAFSHLFKQIVELTN